LAVTPASFRILALNGSLLPGKSAVPAEWLSRNA
jgi:hypothetical protein